MANSALNGLGITAGLTPGPSAQNNAQTAPSAPPEATKVPNPSNLASAAKDSATHGPLIALRAIAGGQLPGVVVPHDAPKIKSSLTPQDIADVGVGLYKPQTKGIAAVLYNPKLVPSTTLSALDKAGKLAHAFPSITKFLNASKKTPNADATDAETPEATPNPNPPDPKTTIGSTPDGNVNSAINDLNLTGAPAPQPPQRVPILPRPTFSADAQKQAALRRMKNLSGQSPMMPGAGSVLNGLVSQAA